MFKISYLIVTLFILALISNGFYSLWKIKKHLHILQLDSYFNSRYLLWLKRKKLEVFHIKSLTPLIALIGTVFQVPLITLILFILIYFRLLLSHPKLPEKKPFVFTPRAKRLFGINIILTIALYTGTLIFWWHKGDAWLTISLIALVAYNFFIPIFLMLTNLLISPLEKLIQYRYFIEASHRIKSIPSLRVIGITGSFGKTTTKHIVTELLRKKFITLATPGSCNTSMGVTKIIRAELKPTHDIFVVEMSAKKPGDIKELCKLVQPQYGLITAIGEQHLTTFKTLENIKKTKNELIESLPQNGISFFNMDDPTSKELASMAHGNVIRYGIKTPEIELDYYVKNLIIDEHGSNFTIVRTSDNSQANFQTKLLGEHNSYNILGAVALASELGIELHEMIHPLKQLAAMPHRLELKHIDKDIIVIDDAFNSNPVGSNMALKVLKQISGKRKIIVTPGMIELGTKEDDYNKIFGEHIADVCNYVILVGKNQTIALQHGLKIKRYPENALFIASDFTSAKQHLWQILQAGDVVLFENDLPDNYCE